MSAQTPTICIALATMEPDGSLSGCTPTFRDLAGYEPEEVAGLHLNNLFPGLEQIPEIQECQHTHFLLRHKNGETIPVAINQITACKTQTILALQDLRWAQELAGMTALVSRIDESRQCLEQFSAVAAHDLKSPLRKINQFARMLRQDYSHVLDWQGNDMLDRMISASDRMGRLIESLLAYSSSASLPLHLEPVDPNRIFEDVVQDLEPQVEDKDVHIEVEALPKLEADPMQLHQLFLNLLSNAIKFSKPRIKCAIRIWSELAEGNRGAFVRIFVQDNGIGFEEYKVERIFKAFEQLQPKCALGGNGLGLAICKKIVERLGGSITAKSETGQGATFIVSLPLHQ